MTKNLKILLIILGVVVGGALVALAFQIQKSTEEGLEIEELEAGDLVINENTGENITFEESEADDFENELEEEKEHPEEYEKGNKLFIETLGIFLKEGDDFDFSIYPYYESFDIENEIYKGRMTQLGIPINENVIIIIDASNAQIFDSFPTEEGYAHPGRAVTFSTLHSISLGISKSPAANIYGKVEKIKDNEVIVKATTIRYFTQ